MNDYRGFEVEPVVFEVISVNKPEIVAENSDSEFSLQEGQYLTEQEYNMCLYRYSLFRISEPLYRVQSVKHPEISLETGVLLTETEMEAWKVKIRPFTGEWVYQTDKGDLLTESEYLQQQKDVKADMKYQIQSITDESCTYKEGIY